MESLLERLSSYNILNNLIPGAFFVFFGKLLNVISLPLDGVVERIFVYYFCGMIISRIGSLVIEGIFEKVKWIKYAPKAEYVAAVKKDARIESLLETSNLLYTTERVIVVGSFATSHHYCPMSVQPPSALTVTSKLIPKLKKQNIIHSCWGCLSLFRAHTAMTLVTDSLFSLMP